jgi:patatin-like phospholipase/acyl hydrolase
MKISAKPYRILSLDGGGTWALIQAKVLMDMYGADTEAKDAW